jgi:hypothetical protein
MLIFIFYVGIALRRCEAFQIGVVQERLPITGVNECCGWKRQPPIWRIAANILNKQLWTAIQGWSSSLGGG